MLGLGTAVLILGSLPVLTYASNRQREFTHTPFQPDHLADPEGPVVVVVLGTGFNPDPELPPTARLDRVFTARFLEGVRVHRLLPDSRLLVSLSGDAGSVADKHRTLDQLATILQLDPERLDLLSEAESTADEAAMTAERCGAEERVVVATSAAHMPRAIQLFTEAGLDPVAAPTEYRRMRPGSPADKAWKRWIPSIDGLQETKDWLYESAARFAR